MTDFLSPRRQHPLGVLILSAQFLWRFGQQAWPLLIGASFSDNAFHKILIGGAVFLALSAVYALIYYLRFAYHVSGDALIVEKGVLRRERLQVPFERIQTIQLFQGPIQQAFRLTGLKVDTAGSAGSELQLVAIRKEEASALQALLRQRSTEAQPQTGGESAVESGVDAGPAEGVDGAAAVPLQSTVETASPESDVTKRELVSLSLGGLLKVGLSQNHLRNAFAGFALVSYGIGNRPDMITSWAESLPPFLAPLVGLAFVLLILPSMVLFLVSGVVFSLVTAVLKYYRLESSIGREGLHIDMGLLRRNTFQVPFERIHVTIWRSNWIRRKLGFETLEVRQAQAQSSSQGGLRVMLPAMEPQHKAILEGELYPDLEAGIPVMQVSPVRRLRWLLWLAALAPLVWVWTFMSVAAAAVFSALWVAFTGWTTAERFASLRMAVHADTVVIEKGWFWQRRILLRLAQIQGVEWERIILLERRAIGHLVFHTAAGPRRFNYIRRTQGDAIRSWAMNQHHAQSRRA